MGIALDEARNALADNEFPVGCVLTHGNEIVARGRRKSTTLSNRNELDHAEIVALHKLQSNHPDIDPSKITAYCTMEPCLMCYAALLLSQVHTIVYAYEDVMGGGTGVPLTRLTPLYRQKDVLVVPHILRNESLQLFKDFFLNPQQNYWQDSYLARYTLDQEIP